MMKIQIAVSMIFMVVLMTCNGQEETATPECVCPFTNPIDDPLCGTDGVSYKNFDALMCESRCSVREGKAPVTIDYRGKCKPKEAEKPIETKEAEITTETKEAEKTKEKTGEY